MYRRTVLTTVGTLSIGTLGGCTRGGIFAGTGGSTSVDRVPLPEIEPATVLPTDARTTLRVRWRAVGASRFDVHPNDGIETTAPDGTIYVVVGYSTTNVGDEVVSFDPGWFALRADGEIHTPEALTHLTASASRPIRPNDTAGGWVAILIPDDTSAVELTITGAVAERPFAVEFEYRSSVWLPF